MAWYDTHQAAVDPDNPAANEQITFDEWNAMVTYLKDKIIDKAVNDAAIGNDKVLVYKTATSTFVFEAQSAVGAIDDLTDVTISGVPADNEVLAYDTGTSEWINQTAAEAGLATVAGLAAYYPLSGATLTGNLNMGDYLIDDVDDIQAYDASGILFRDNAGNVCVRMGSSGQSFMAYYECDMNTHKILNVVDPTTAQGASTKNYDDTHLFTKEVVTSFTDGYIPVYRTASGKFEMEAQSGGNLTNPMTVNLSMGTNKITALVDPTAAQEASTKNYADTHLLTKEAVTNFTDGYIAVYRTASGKFEMEAGAESAGLPVSDATSIVKGSADSTKRMRFEVDGLTAGVTRIMTIPDKDMTLCGLDDALLLSGGTMAGAINIGGYTTTAINAFKAYGSLGISILNHQGTTKLKLGEVDKSFVAYETADMDGHDLDDIGALILNAATELTIATGVVTVTQSYHTIDTEGGDATDNLSTINGGGEGQTLTIRADNSARTVVVQDGLGNLQLEGDMSLDNAQDTISLLHDGTNWLETSRSNNGA